MTNGKEHLLRMVELTWKGKEGSLNDMELCPSQLGLMDRQRCVPGVHCRSCWREALEEEMLVDQLKQVK